LLEQEGAECAALPLIRIKALDDYSELDDKIKNIDDFHWLIFTSQNGVRFFQQRLKAQKKDVRALAGIKVAAIGPKTREAVEALGITVDLQPKDFRQEGLLAALKEHDIKGKNILIVRAREARDVLPQGLEKLGAGVCVVSAYRAELRKEKVSLPGFLAGFDLVTFTSSSCVQGLFQAFSRKEIFSRKNRFKIASIGPVTSATCRKYKLKAEIVAKSYTLDGLAQAILGYYKKHKLR